MTYVFSWFSPFVYCRLRTLLATNQHTVQPLSARHLHPRCRSLERNDAKCQHLASRSLLRYRVLWVSCEGWALTTHLRQARVDRGKIMQLPYRSVTYATCWLERFSSDGWIA